ncbi:mannosyltransferase complex subunit [Schizosaccharomyces cryophilus OY26]|uniref:Mannosyltransferase complex subunit n=1 Tax=Schizosaccharomyces cryophilus (strain OY26 / ATCC MYA-4695 / CBS 11777 / NBRC 106824 / NRRL Y48691) TaxID=653667 RepID=S9W0C5_SCHCR|nr:mannosyltransferase complex subunit [Schizosaccharomyces cryophilus OY26]EPY51510.1 mannosyltransferase complex subunit [Schizosaccharomyces cryophilus OY26]
MVRRTRKLFIVTISLLTFVFIFLKLSAYCQKYVYLLPNGKASTLHLNLQEMEASSGSSTSSQTKSKIPKIIHQIWKDENIPDKWSVSVNSCRTQHPEEDGWTVKLWTDEMALSFMETNYQWFMPIYHSYPYDIQRFDAVRYFIVYHYGGVYMDLDVGCKKSMDPLLDEATFLLPITDPIGYSNDWFAATPRHAFLYKVITSLSKFNHRYFTKYPTVLLSTGPLFFSFIFCQYLSESHSKVRTLPPALYGNGPVSFFSHVHGSSWHGSDASAYFWMQSHILYVFISIFVCILLLLFLSVKFFAAQRRNRSNHRREMQQELYP